MNDQEKIKIFKKVLNLKGIEHQDLKLKEECSELLTEFIRFETGRNEFNSKELIEEIADVIITMNQYTYNHYNIINIDNLYKSVCFDVEEIKQDLCNICKNKITFAIRLNIDQLYNNLINFCKHNNILDLVYIQIESKLKLLEQRALVNDLL